MAIPKRLHASGTYFITSVTHNRRRLFQVDRNAQLFLETLQHYRREGHYLLHAFVIMPDHIHLLLTPQQVTLERAMMLIKGGFSHRLKATHPVWQKSFTDHRIRNREDFHRYRDYIHQNPVRARLCRRPEYYPHSSAHTNPQKQPAGEASTGWLLSQPAP